MRRALAGLLLLGLLAGTSKADKDAAGEVEARAFFRQAVAKFQSGQYEAALELYQQAYLRLPSPKILLNIGTTLKQLGRNAEAAMTYQRYLRDPGADKARRKEVARLLKELDAKVGRLRIESPSVAKIKVDGEVVGEGQGTIVVRVEPGRHEVRAERSGAAPFVANVTVIAGADRRVSLARASPAAAAPPPPAPVPPPAPEPRPSAAADAAPPPRIEEEAENPETEVSARTGSRPRRFGAFLRTDVDGKLRGAVVAAGATVRLASFVDLSAAGLIGEHPGFYVGSHLSWPDGRLRGVLTFGAPVYFIDGARVAAHAALGGRFDLTERLSATLEAGIEWFPDVPLGYETLVFVPSLGVRFLL